MRIDYDGICALAAEIGCRRDDLIALSPGNDPFYVRLPSRKEAAEWFANLWDGLGFKVGSHPRRLHYTIISQSPAILKPNGAPYFNTENDWQFLLRASLAARYLRLIPDGALADHRNHPPIINAVNPGTTLPAVKVYGGGGAGLEFNLPSNEVRPPFLSTEDITVAQEYLVEVWVEKSTQNDILVPLAASRGFNLVPGTGETSEILARQVVERALSDGRPMRILHVSDFDPGGRSMPVALARKIEFWLAEADIDLDITLSPIVLTPGQCEHFRLPRTPLKETERRAAKFEDRFGAGATELDALEALYPGELARIVSAEIGNFLDPTLASRMREADWAFKRLVWQVQDEVLARFDITDIKSRYEAACLEFREKVETIEAETEALWPQIAEEMEAAAPEFDPADLPEPQLPDPPEGPLFDSRRDYLDQIDAYRAWQVKGGAA